MGNTQVDHLAGTGWEPIVALTAPILRDPSSRPGAVQCRRRRPHGGEQVDMTRVPEPGDQLSSGTDLPRADLRSDLMRTHFDSRRSGAGPVRWPTGGPK